MKVIPGKTNNLKIKLAPNGITLNEVVVKPKKEKYSKKENPAVKFVKQVIASRESNDPRNHDYFQYDQYEKMVFAMNDYHPKPKKNGKPGKSFPDRFCAIRLMSVRLSFRCRKRKR